MKIDPFGVEIWMNEFETTCELNLAETCVESLTIAELMAIAGRNDDDLSALLPMKMTYGAIEGSERLRAAICRLYEDVSPERVLVTHGTIGANELVHKTLVSRGDKVIAVTPTYQQHYSIPESIGAEVYRLPLRREDDFRIDLGALRRLTAGGARLIAFANPNNPTGALMGREVLEEVAEIARAAGAWVLSDEVYRGTEQAGDALTPSMADIYERGISTASVSKAFSLAGLRLGWIAGPEEVAERVMIHRDYNTISVGMLDDHFATMALEAADKVLARSRRIVRGNLATLAEWVAAEPLIDWVKPQAGTTALLQYGVDMSSRDFCVALLKETGVMFTPGSALGMEGCVRIGYANGPEVLKAGLARVSDFLKARGV